MCTGFEIAALAAAAVAAVGSIAGAQQQSSMAKYNARVGENNAQASRDMARLREEQHRRNVLRLQSRQQAQLGASGRTAEGNPLMIFAEDAAGAEFDALLIRHEGEIGAGRYEAQAGLDRARGNAALTHGYLNAGSSLLTGYARYGRTASAGVDVDDPTLTPGTSGDWYRPNAFSTNVDGLGWE